MNVRQEGSRSHPERISSFSQLYYKPKEETPVIAIRMPDGVFIRSDELSHETLKTYIDRGIAYVSQRIVSVSYGRGQLTVYLDEKDQLSMLIVDIHEIYTDETIPGKPPAISAADSDGILEFPLKEKELKEVFGEPTNEETYEFVT